MLGLAGTGKRGETIQVSLQHRQEGSLLYANEEQYEAQNDVRDELTQDKDESMDTEDDTRLGTSLLETKMKEAFKPMEEKMRRLEQQNKALQKQLKAKTRQKSSGGGTGHSLNAKSNGHENERDSPNPSRQQSQKQKQKQRAQRHQNQNRPCQGRQRRAKQKLRKELNQACRQEEEPMRRAEERIASVRSYLLKKDGFLANPKLSPRHNAENILAETKVSEITSRVPNMKYHDLCTHLTPPAAGVGDLLGLSLPFCLQAHVLIKTLVKQCLD